MQQGALFQDDPVTGAAADPQNADLNHYAPYHEAYGASPINVTHHGGYANYNALQTSWQKQTGRITYNLNYTWSKTLGIVSGKLNPFVLRDNYGVTNIDRAHVVNLSYTLDLGSLYHGNSFLAGAANGWTIAGITTWQSGPNLQAVFSPNFKLQSTAGDPLSNRVWFGTDAISLQPMLTCNPTSQLGDNQFVNGNCFTPPPVGQNGPYQYPYISGPAFFNSDLAVYKTFKVTERQNLQFRFSAFNFLNHPLVSFNPNATGNLELKFAQNGSSYSLNNPTFGIADIKQGRRVMELALKYTF